MVLLERIVPVILAVHAKSLVFLRRPHLKRVQHVLKLTFLSVLKWRPAKKFWDLAYDALTSMGFEVDAKNARKWLFNQASSPTVAGGSGGVKGLCVCVCVCVCVHATVKVTQIVALKCVVYAPTML